jgi:ribosome-binding protein aMBF1 (putative translation factor)
MDCQDWTPTTITSTKAATAAKTVAGTARAARIAPEVAHARKIEHAEVPMKPKQLTPESRQEIVSKRAAMKKSQVELNQLCNFPVNTIREIEAGRLPPSIGQLNTLNRVLKTGLKMA